MSTTTPSIAPTNLDEVDNPLRPASFDEMVGQDHLKPILKRLVASARTRREPLDHLLLVGGSGTGKTTTATVIARELGRRVFMLKAPLSTGVLDELRHVARDCDVVFIDEIHMQVSGDRRGITQACDPESFYQLLEDGMLSTAAGVVPFPRVTWIGATTDVGLLPEALINRFPLQPRLEPYSVADMAVIAGRSARRTGLRFADGVSMIFARACRGNPRQLNSYVRSARSLATGAMIDQDIASEVVTDLNATTLDGLTESMQMMLRFVYRNGRRVNAAGETVYQSGIGAIATACGHGRDTKAIALLVEPYLIERGYVTVTPSGRALTATGVQRAGELCGDGSAGPRTAEIAAEPIIDTGALLDELQARTVRLMAELRSAS